MWFPKEWFWQMLLCTEISCEKSSLHCYLGRRKLCFLIFLDPNNRNEGTFTKTALLQNRPFVPLEQTASSIVLLHLPPEGRVLIEQILGYSPASCGRRHSRSHERPCTNPLRILRSPENFCGFFLRNWQAIWH